jgi:hypothetical protein
LLAEGFAEDFAALPLPAGAITALPEALDPAGAAAVELLPVPFGVLCEDADDPDDDCA